jgi:HlyD family secretion protein
MDREIDPAIRRSRLTRRVAIGLTILVGALLVLGALPRLLQPSVRRDRIRVARVMRGPVEATIEASGTAAPAFERVLSSPVDARVVRILKRAGASVKPGDPIVELDLAATRLEADRLVDRLAQKQNEVDQIRLELDRTLAGLDAKLETARLDLEIARYRLDQRRKLHDDLLISDEGLKESEVEAKKAELTHHQLQAEVDSARRASAAREAGLKLDLEILRKELGEARRQLELASARSDRDGVVTWVLNEEGAAVHNGDVLARVADLGSYRIEATVSDVHVARLAAGQRARVIVAGETLTGHVATVRPAVENGVALFTVELDKSDDPRLRKDLRVDVYVVTATRGDALGLDRGAFTQGGASQDVFLVHGDRAVRTKVRTGLSGQTATEVLEGLSEGDEVIVSDMRDYLQYPQLRVK